MAGKLGKKDMAKNAVVHASVHIGQTEELDGLGIAVDMKVEGVDDEVLKAGHEVRSSTLTTPTLDKLVRRSVHIAVHSSMVHKSTSQRLESNP
jgi:hypothetical protein